jgi:flagellar biosynthesis component FlhA
MANDFGKFFEILATKMSRKAVVIALAMVLLYLLGSNPATAMLVFSSVAIGALAIFCTMLQWIADVKSKKEREEKKEETPEEIRRREVEEKEQEKKEEEEKYGSG